MSSEKKLASAVGAKTARACDNCIRKRARWYCAADDAFLCQSCDSSVHSANPLARSHERVRLKTSSFKSSDEFSYLGSSVSGSGSGLGLDLVPSWHRGFTKKARTPRHGNKHAKRIKSTVEEEEMKNPIQLIVPEILSDENSNDENEEEQLLYRVPIFDPFMADGSNYGNEYSSSKVDFNNDDVNRLHGMLAPSEMELAEFAADVESLLGKGLDDEEPFNYIEGLGCLEKHDEKLVKVEDEGEVGFVNMVSTNHDTNQVDYSDIDMVGEKFELKFDYDSHVISNLDEDKKVEFGEINNDSEKSNNNKVMLNLDYEGILNSWANKRSPWTTGERPEVDFNDCWPLCMGNCGKIHPYDIGIMNGHGGVVVDEGREARVLRYKEKRRTRLFSKKIRYKVRKLNAEKRPRMKGRFIKRVNFAPTPFPSLNK